MSHWTELRAQAREQHRVLLGLAGGDSSAAALLKAAAELTDIHPKRLASGDPLLDGALAVLDRDAELIYYNRDTDPAIVALLLAHEYAHGWLEHDDCARCTAEQIDPEASDEDVPLGTAQVQGYSPEERREREANVYARELLLPSDTLRAWYLDQGLGASAIAARTGLPDGMVLHQLSHALLTPEAGPAAQPAGEEKAPLPDLDPSQREAAFEPEGPVLTEAGPGTGKTRTLVARVGYLLGRGEDAGSILGLTFSIKAAEEMRERIARIAPVEAPQMVIGTFHSFGLEVLRKYGHHLNYPKRLRVLDPASALFMMERMLPALGLVHYQNLYEPTLSLRDLLDAISRAKDELRTPDEYDVLARAMREKAADEEQVERAERALEVARVYRVYQDHLDAERMVDFGDLIFRTVELLRAVPAVRTALANEFRNILVDEYQDVNRASGALLEELVEVSGGRGLWVVGDARQSIYRWRGASSANMRLFRERFPQTKVKVLAGNYRSQPAVVDLVSSFARKMVVGAGEPFEPWKANREDQGGRVLMEVASDGRAEAQNIAREIERRRREENVSYRSQAVLCRSHTQLARIAAGLERNGVPVLYLGDLFERTEIRDMLALLSLACEGRGRGLVRVARFPEYQIPDADVISLLRAAREREVPFPRAVGLAAELDGISADGRAGLLKLRGQLDGLCYGSNAWGMVVRYLFERSAYIRLLAADVSVEGQQKRLALFQFLEFAHQNRELEAPDDARDPKRAFLDYVRRLEVFGEEKQLRHLPESAAAIDAVRLLTIHASKGLQFPVVYVPGLAAGSFPAKKQRVACPAPDGLVQGGAADVHEEEEQCLFFVAISRAEDVLCLSRPATQGGKNSNPSSLLTALAAALPRPPGSAPTWLSDAPAMPAAALVPPGEPRVWDEKVLETYMRCPKQYFYERIMDLGGLRDDTAYVQLHKCVYDVVRWLQTERVEGRSRDGAGALGRLDETWAAHGPVGHAYEEMYRSGANAMVQMAVGELTGAHAPAERPEWEVNRPLGRIRFTPDHIVFADGGQDGSPTVYRLRTGRLGSDELEKPIYGLYQHASGDAYPGLGVTVQAISLSTGERRLVELNPRPLATRLGKYDAAIEGILREQFPAKPKDARSCPRCPHYFICPMGGEA